MEVRTRQATRMALSLEAKGEEKKTSPAANRQLPSLHRQKQHLRRTNMVYRRWAWLTARPGKGTGTSEKEEEEDERKDSGVQ